MDVGLPLQISASVPHNPCVNQIFGIVACNPLPLPFPRLSSFESFGIGSTSRDVTGRSTSPTSLRHTETAQSTRADVLNMSGKRDAFLQSLKRIVTLATHQGPRCHLEYRGRLSAHTNGQRKQPICPGTPNGDRVNFPLQLGTANYRLQSTCG
jgi:hypothetical protein